ncbi:MAG TPA: diguanylate cyclase [Geobacteraceae bacterium]
MPVSILIIDDSETVREQIVQTLATVRVFDIYHQAEDGIEAFKTLLTTPIDLIICDLEMPRMDGFKFLTMVSGREELKGTPVIMLTGRENREMKIKGLEQGACDYVTKPFDPGELIARVKVQLKIKMLQDELKKSNELLTRLSNTDHLTQLYNRRYLMEMLEREVQRSYRKGAALSIVMLDIDHFKRVNDVYGHQDGDQVLRTVAGLAQKDLRSYDFAARYGGEEFMLILPETTHDEAMIVAERLRRIVERQTFTGTLSRLFITISMGVATFQPPQVATIDALIREADEALYRAKQWGRNRVVSMLQKQPG